MNSYLIDIKPITRFSHSIFQAVMHLGHLIKIRLVLAILLTVFTALLLEGSLMNRPVRFWGVITGVMMAAAAVSGLNQIYDRDLDSTMERTRLKRPIPSGRISVKTALWICALCAAGSITLLHLFGSSRAVLLTLISMSIYMMYTCLLKRRTPLNIVIGGISGALAPLIGWSAGSGPLSIKPLLLSLIVFFWSPPHFWALALWKKDDYARAGIPMMPVVSGTDRTLLHTTIYSILLICSVCLFTHYVLHRGLYLGFTIPLNALLALHLATLIKNKDTESARKFFRFSIVYVIVTFGIMIISDFNFQFTSWLPKSDTA